MMLATYSDDTDGDGDTDRNQVPAHSCVHDRWIDDCRSFCTMEETTFGSASWQPALFVLFSAIQSEAYLEVVPTVLHTWSMVAIHF